MKSSLQSIDHSALKFNQLAIIVLVTAGYVFDTAWLPALVGVVLLAGSWDDRLALFKQLYRRIIRPWGLMKSHLVEDIAAPHEFAQLLGGLFLAASVLSLIAGRTVVGWLLAGMVVVLALVNVAFGFCAGCFMYYQMGKLGIRGFKPSTNLLPREQ